MWRVALNNLYIVLRWRHDISPMFRPNESSPEEVGSDARAEVETGFGMQRVDLQRLENEEGVVLDHDKARRTIDEIANAGFGGDDGSEIDLDRRIRFFQ
jgi:hypothetical protein